MYPKPLNKRTWQYQIGWKKYACGLPLSDCDNDEQRRGWMAANKAEGWAMTAGVMA